MARILVCDTDPERNDDYNLESIISECGLSDIEVINADNWNEANKIIEIDNKFNLMIVSYNFKGNDSYEAIDFIKKHRDIPSIFLDYQAHRGISKYVRDTTPARCVYKNDATYVLRETIKGIIKNKS